MRADVGRRSGSRIGDQHAEDAAAARQVADGARRRRVDPDGEEALELARRSSRTPSAA